MDGAPTIELRLLGGFALLVDGSERQLTSRKAQLLLARLALEPRGVGREVLADMLWGSHEAEQARQSLRRALADLRRALGRHSSILASNGDVVRLDISAIQCDALMLVDEAGNRADTGAVEIAPLLPAATFIEAAAQEWLDRERAGIAQLSLLAFDRRIERAMSRRDFVAAERHVLDALSVEPMREALHRTLMQVHVARGEPSRALKQFGALRSLLERELGVRPEPESTALYERTRTERSKLPAKPMEESTPADDALPITQTDQAVLHGSPISLGLALRSAPEQIVRFCRTGDGITLAYAEVGCLDEQRTPLLKAANWLSHLEHDWDSPVWRHWIGALTHERCLVRYDERANGLSDWDVDDVSFEAMVADLEAVADAAIGGPFVLVGISQGCAISVAYAHRHPERVKGLVLYGGYVRGWRVRADAHEIARREAMETLILEGWGQDIPAFRQMFTSLFIPGAGTDEMDWFNELQRVSVSPKNAVRLSEAFGAIDVSACLPDIAVPTLVLHARGDLVCPLAGGRELASCIPRARFVTLESSNHILLAHEPAFAEFERHLAGFLAELD